VPPTCRLDAPSFPSADDLLTGLEPDQREVAVALRGPVTFFSAGHTGKTRAYARPHGDLAALVAAQLRGLGLPAESIDDVGGCTHDEPTLYFSHRRDAGRTGRHLSGIVARGVEARGEGATNSSRDRGTSVEG